MHLGMLVLAGGVSVLCFCCSCAHIIRLVCVLPVLAALWFVCFVRQYGPVTYKGCGCAAGSWHYCFDQKPLVCITLCAVSTEAVRTPWSLDTLCLSFKWMEPGTVLLQFMFIHTRSTPSMCVGVCLPQACVCMRVHEVLIGWRSCVPCVT